MKKDVNFYRKFGISQGRLTESNELQRFPYESWQDEFSNASKLNISFIELLTERKYNKNNPVWSKNGREEIKNLCAANNLEIYSICVDYIIDHSLLNDKSSTTHLEKIFMAASELGCKIVILPLLEESNIDANNSDQFIDILNYLSDKAQESGLIICIESILNSTDLAKFLGLLNKKNVKSVFDTGNRALKTRNLYSEITILKNYIAHVHIKDKDMYGENVILGTGLVNFSEIFSALHDINYKGPLNFETTRGSDPLKTAAFHINFCNFFTDNANL